MKNIFTKSRLKIYFKSKRVYRKYYKNKFEIVFLSISFLFLILFLKNKDEILHYDYNYLIKIQTLRRLSYFTSEILSDVHVKFNLSRILERTVNNTVVINELKSLIKNFIKSNYVNELSNTFFSLTSVEKYIINVFEEVFTNENTVFLLVSLGKDACLDYDFTYNSLIKALVDCSVFTLTSQASIRGYTYFISSLYEDYQLKKKGFEEGLIFFEVYERGFDRI